MRAALAQAHEEAAGVRAGWVEGVGGTRVFGVRCPCGASSLAYVHQGAPRAAADQAERRAWSNFLHQARGGTCRVCLSAGGGWLRGER